MEESTTHDTLSGLYDGSPIEDFDEFERVYKKLISLSEEYCKNGRIHHSKAAIDTLESSLELHQSNSSSSEQDKAIEDINSHLKNNENLLRRVKKESEMVEKVHQDFMNVHEWNLVQADGTYTVSYKKDPNSSIHKVKLSGVVTAELLHVLAVIIELDLYSQWVPFYFGTVGLKKCVELAHLEKLRKLGYFYFGLPWPLSDRDMSIEGYGADMLDKGKLLIVLQNCNEYPDVIIPKPSIPRVDLKSGGVLVVPLDEGKVDVSFIFSFDPKISILPDAILNFGMETFAKHVFHRLCTVAENVYKNKDCLYKKRIDERKELYTFLEQRISIFKKNKN